MGTGVGVGVGSGVGFGVGTGVGAGVGAGVGFGVGFGVAGVSGCAGFSAFLSHAAKRKAINAQEMIKRLDIDLGAGSEFRAAQRSPRFLRRYIHNPRLSRARWRKDGQKNQPLGKWIKCPMHLAHRDECRFAGAEDAMLLAHPLLRAPGNNIDQFLAGRVRVKRVAATGLHIGADQKKLFIIHYIAATDPLFEGPRRLEINFLCGSDKSTRIAHA